MTTRRITITLPDKTAERLRRRAAETGRAVSRLIAEDVEAQERQRLKEHLIEDYKAAALEEETRRVTAELEGIDAEDWPE